MPMARRPQAGGEILSTMCSSVDTDGTVKERIARKIAAGTARSIRHAGDEAEAAVTPAIADAPPEAPPAPPPP